MLQLSEVYYFMEVGEKGIMKGEHFFFHICRVIAYK